MSVLVGGHVLLSIVNGSNGQCLPLYSYSVKAKFLFP